MAETPVKSDCMNNGMRYYWEEMILQYDLTWQQNELPVDIYVDVDVRKWNKNGKEIM